jgi:flagellum-specific peptidoglycan hydrolase FlgJ
MSATKTEQIAALAIIAPLAAKAERLYGVPAEITCGQAMIESQWMKAPIGFNCFGMKKAARHKMSAWRRTSEVLSDAQLEALKRKVVTKKIAPDGSWDVVIEDEFAGYPSFEASVMDYAWLVTSADRYVKAYESYKKSMHDWPAYAHGIVASGYATGRGYGDLVIAVANMGTVRDAIAKARLMGTKQ